MNISEKDERDLEVEMQVAYGDEDISGPSFKRTKSPFDGQPIETSDDHSNKLIGFALQQLSSSPMQNNFMHPGATKETDNNRENKTLNRL